MKAIRGLIGVVHLPAMPGDPNGAKGAVGAEGFVAVEAHALADAETLAEGGVDGLILENFGSTPFAKERTPPHQVATLALLARECVRRFDLPVGINCLRNDVFSALGIAAAAGAHFVRVNVHTGAYVTDQGLIEGRAHDSLRYRRSLDVEVGILADVLVKHAAPLAPLTPTEAVRDCLERGLADGVIVTGAATGAATSVDDLREVRQAAGVSPVYVGSGITPDNAATIAPLVDGAIVGTWLKRDGDVSAPVDRARVETLVGAFNGRFCQAPG